MKYTLGIKLIVLIIVVLWLTGLYITCNKPINPASKIEYIAGKTDTIIVTGSPDTVIVSKYYPVFITKHPNYNTEISSVYDTTIKVDGGTVSVFAETFPKTDSVKLEIVPLLSQMTIIRTDTIKMFRTDTLTITKFETVKPSFYETPEFAAGITAAFFITLFFATK